MAVEQEMAEIYPPDAEDLSEYLPDLDCGECGFASCIEFSEALLESRISPKKCPELGSEVSEAISAIVALDKNPIPYNLMMEQEACRLIEICRPPPDTPLLVTANFCETVRIMKEILEQTGTPAFLLPTYTHGYSVDNAVHERMFRAIEVFKAMNENGVAEKVSRPLLVIPGLASSEKNTIRRITQWEVLEGPDSGFLLPLFLRTMII
jgi:CO dehydrogenase/acetyl-CoA synthase gamma subunit (corrinoid Fe-S protein)